MPAPLQVAHTQCNLKPLEAAFLTSHKLFRPRGFLFRLSPTVLSSHHLHYAINSLSFAVECAVTIVEVQTYSGYKSDERPLRLKLGQQTLEILEVEDRWYSPGETYFRVRVETGDRYVLRHIEAQDTWTIEAYRNSSL
jgi:hypothetical protein